MIRKSRWNLWINQDIHRLKGKVSSNVGAVIEAIINEKPHI